jgi:glycosyl transferase family 1
VRVLFLDHPEADFLAAILFLGLYDELGPENVVCYPHKPSYCGQRHAYPSCYEQPPGTVPWHGWSGGVHPMGYTDPFAWMPALYNREHSRDEVVAALDAGQFDLVVVASPRDRAVGAFRDLAGAVGRSRLPDVVLCDGEDYWELRTDIAEEIDPRVYFKRELMPQMRRSGLRIHPLPFASPIPPQESVPKDIDILMLGGSTWPDRDRATAALRARFGERLVGGAGIVLEYPDYLAHLARARVAVSVRGHGYDTLRFWEIPSFEGTMLACDVLPIVRPRPFKDGVHAGYFRTPEELVAVVERALSDEPWRAKIASAGNAHLRDHHTARARAAQMLEASFAS